MWQILGLPRPSQTQCATSSSRCVFNQMHPLRTMLLSYTPKGKPPHYPRLHRRRAPRKSGSRPSRLTGTAPSIQAEERLDQCGGLSDTRGFDAFTFYHLAFVLLSIIWEFEQGLPVWLSVTGKTRQMSFTALNSSNEIDLDLVPFMDSPSCALAFEFPSQIQTNTRESQSHSFSQLHSFDPPISIRSIISQVGAHPPVGKLCANFL